MQRATCIRASPLVFAIYYMIVVSSPRSLGALLIMSSSKEGYASRFSAQAPRVVPGRSTRGGGAGLVVKRDLVPSHTAFRRGGSDSDVHSRYFAWLARQSSSPRFAHVVWNPRLGLDFFWLPPLHQRPKPNYDHFSDEKRDHNLKDGRASPAPGGWALSSEESGRNKPSIPWMGDGGVFAAASFGPPTPTFWLEAGPEVFACTERGACVQCWPHETRRARLGLGSLLLCICPPSFSAH